VYEKKKKLKFLVVALRASNVGIPHRGERTFLNKIQYGDLIRLNFKGSDFGGPVDHSHMV
jgi:hypothetical protein